MNRPLGAALTVELDKLRRSPLIAICTLVVVLAPTVLAAAANLVLRTHSAGGFAAKARLLVEGTGWEAYLGTGAQVMSVAVLLSLGFGYAWCFGREFAERTVVNLFALPVGRGDIAVAKVVALVVWSATASLASSALLLLGGLAMGPLDEAGAQWWRPLLVCLLTACNTLPLTWVATIRRGYLGSLGALLGLVVATQLLVAVGGGAWFPWAVPGLWAGFGGTEITVSPVQLLLPVVVGLVSVAATVHAWRRLQLGDA